VKGSGKVDANSRRALAARAAAQIAIAWHDDHQTIGSAEHIERMQALIRRIDEVLREVAPGVQDGAEHDQDAIVLVSAQRSIH
jgi:hypothetical protein